jgi:metal-sulfur cluster biosynthetic enzyme
MISQSQAVEILKGVIDPDVGINIVDLGLVENVTTEAQAVKVALIMTTPACPQTSYLQDECARLLNAAGATATVQVLAEPLWDPSRMSETAKQTLGWNS